MRQVVIDQARKHLLIASHVVPPSMLYSHSYDERWPADGATQTVGDGPGAAPTARIFFSSSRLERRSKPRTPAPGVLAVL
jgi:hypothetical protein